MFRHCSMLCSHGGHRGCIVWPLVRAAWQFPEAGGRFLASPLLSVVRPLMFSVAILIEAVVLILRVEFRGAAVVIDYILSFLGCVALILFLLRSCCCSVLLTRFIFFIRLGLISASCACFSSSGAAFSQLRCIGSTVSCLLLRSDFTSVPFMALESSWSSGVVVAHQHRSFCRPVSQFQLPQLLQVVGQCWSSVQGDTLESRGSGIYFRDALWLPSTSLLGGGVDMFSGLSDTCLRTCAWSVGTWLWAVSFNFSWASRR